MDERIKSIRRLRGDHLLAQRAAAALLAGVGKAALDRLCAQESLAGQPAELAAYQKLSRAIEETSRDLERLSEERARLTRLEGEELAARHALQAKSRAALSVYRDLGRLYLADGPDNAERASFKDKEAVFCARIDRAKEHIASLNAERGSGFIGFFAACAKKAQASRDINAANAGLLNLYTDYGAQLARTREPAAADTVAALTRDFLAARALAREIQELEETREGKKREITAITERWKSSGRGTAEALREDITLMEAERRLICERAGAAAGADKSSPYNAVLHTDDLLTLDNIQKERDKIAGIEDKIQRLEQSLEADIRHTRIEKLEKRAQAKRLQISKLESDITALEEESARIKKEIIHWGA